MFNRNSIVWTSSLSVLIIALLAVHLSNTPVQAAAHRGEDDGYQPVVLMEPSSVEAGQPVNLTLRLFQPDGVTPLVSLDEVHTKLLHLILVSQDLNQFLHVHPEYQGEGVFVLNDLTLPSDDNYAVFADFTPTNRTQEVVRMELPRPDATLVSPALEVSTQEFTAGPLKITVDVPETLSAGIEQSLVFHVADAEIGVEVDTLDEYLGAAGHLVIIDESGQTYLHTHPAEHETHDMGGMEMDVHYGPDLEFVTEFPAIGLYKMWLQVQYEGEVYTAPFVIEVGDKVDSPAESTEEAHEAHG